MIKKKVKGYLNGESYANMREILKTTIEMDSEFVNGKMDLFIKDIGEMGNHWKWKILSNQ